MGAENIQDVVKILTGIWIEQEKKISAEEVRKWIQPHIPQIASVLGKKENLELLKTISASAFPDGEWQGAVALNQIIYLGKIAENPENATQMLKKFLDVWNRQPLNLSALIVEWRRNSVGTKLDPEIILDTLTYDASKQSYFDPAVSESGTEFFVNMYRDEFGINMNDLTDAVSKIVGDDLVDEFFRLVDIDAPMAPEEFVRRVEKAVEILATAKEQGLDVKRIFKKWDEMANAGGERMRYLAGAVKAVAEEAVRERFWGKILERMKQLKVPVIDDGYDASSLLAVLQSQGFVKIDREGLEITKEFDTILQDALGILLKINPAAVYTAGDVLRVVESIASNSPDKATTLSTAQVLSLADSVTLTHVFSGDRMQYVVSAVRETVINGHIKAEEVALAMRSVEIRDGMPVENYISEILNKIHEIKER